jgi:hypothetical protein
MIGKEKAARMRTRLRGERPVARLMDTRTRPDRAVGPGAFHVMQVRCGVGPHAGGFAFSESS